MEAHSLLNHCSMWNLSTLLLANQRVWNEPKEVKNKRNAINTRQREQRNKFYNRKSKGRDIWIYFWPYSICSNQNIPIILLPIFEDHSDLMLNRKRKKMIKDQFTDLFSNQKLVLAKKNATRIYASQSLQLVSANVLWLPWGKLIQV